MPRAATTSLYEALGRHPEIYAPTLKEACFTCPDVDPRTHHRVATRFFSVSSPISRGPIPSMGDSLPMRTK